MIDDTLYDYNFLKSDKKLGLTVIVDGVNVYDKCNADLIDYEVVPATINKDIYKHLGKHDYRLNSFSLGEMLLNLSFYLGADTQHNAFMNLNNLLSLFLNKIPIIKIGDTDFEYVCVIESSDVVHTTVKHYYKVDLVLNAIKRLSLVSLTFDNTTSTKKIKYSGSIPCGINIVFVTNKNNSTVRFKLNDGEQYTFYKTNEDYNTFNIDGIKGKILAATSYNNYVSGNTVNWFLNTDIIDFPKLVYGENTLQILTQLSDIQNIKVEYYPLFVI